MTARSKRPTVAVIGGGFSGLLTTVRLLSDPEGPKVRLIERRSTFARGAAYSTEDPAHLLNVRASNMSAFPEAPSHFLDWLASPAGGGYDLGAKRDAFVSRREYGDYLQSLLRATTETCAAGRLILDADEAVAVEKVGDGWRVTLGVGRAVTADAVVLATGNLPPAAPAAFPAEATASPAYVTNPWSIAPDALPQSGSALLIGSGLTMIDVAMHLSRLRPDLRMTTLSRRGLLPRRHLAEGPAPLAWTLGEDRTPRALLAAARGLSHTHDWRAVIDGLRPHVRALWRHWPQAERGRFLRHLRPWWDVHRHRLAPAVASRLDHLMGSGRLTVLAGAVRGVALTNGGFDIDWTPRGEREVRRLHAQVVVNCTGPNNDLAACAEPLLQQLLKDGLVRADSRRLGLDVDADSRLIGQDGAPHPALFAVGPITRGAFWEITSVPDIRIQAAECAALIARRLALAS